MKEILNEYGSTIVTIVIAAVIVALLGGLTIGNATGIIDIFGNNAEKMADTDTVDSKSTPVTVLDAQAAEIVPELEVITNPVEAEPILVDDIFTVTNNVKDVGILVAEITTTLNDISTDAFSQGLVTIDGQTLTFTQRGNYYLTVDIYQKDIRKLSRTFKITVEEPAITWTEYEYRYINGYWGYYQVDYTKRGEKITETLTLLKKYPKCWMDDIKTRINSAYSRHDYYFYRTDYNPNTGKEYTSTVRHLPGSFRVSWYDEKNRRLVRKTFDCAHQCPYLGHYNYFCADMCETFYDKTGENYYGFSYAGAEALSSGNIDLTTGIPYVVTNYMKQHPGSTLEYKEGANVRWD